MRKDQCSPGAARAEPARPGPDDPATQALPRFSAGDRIWAEAWSAAADDGGWMVDDVRPGHPSGPGTPDILFVYPPASAGRGVAWRRAHQIPYTLTPLAAGVTVHDPVYAGLPARHRTCASLRVALLSLADMTPALRSLVDALAKARADFGHGAELSVVPAFATKRRRA